MVTDKFLLRLRPRASTELDKATGTLTVEKVGETLTPNMRALRLAITASDLLLSMGVSANSVVSRALDITETYCEKPVHISITVDLITVSQVRGIKYEPLTLIRPATQREVNNMTIQAVQQLIYEIRRGQHTLEEAEEKLDNILRHPRTYPKWLTPASNAFIAPAVVLMFSTNWRAIVVTYAIALIVDRLLLGLARKSVVPFFRQIIASTVVTFAAALIAWLARNNVRFFSGMDSTLIVVGGIIMLLAGLAIVGAVQDAIDEYYVTANARLLRVFLLTTGIVIGILVGLYSAHKVGMGITVSSNPLHLAHLRYQVIGGALAAAAYALAMQSRLRAIIWTGLLGAGSLAIMYACIHAGLATIPSSGVAAAFVGLTAQLFSRRWKTPSSGVIAAGIVPLVPGLGIYLGLMQLVNYPPGNVLFFHGIATLFTAIGTALAIAAGASFGSMLGRPLYRHVTHNRNLLAFAAFPSTQLHADTKAAKRMDAEPDDSIS